MHNATLPTAQQAISHFLAKALKANRLVVTHTYTDRLPAACLVDHFYYNPAGKISQRLQQQFYSPLNWLFICISISNSIGGFRFSFGYVSLHFDCFIATGGIYTISSRNS